MSERFDGDDYSEYFARLERQIVSPAGDKDTDTDVSEFALQKEHTLNHESVVPRTSHAASKSKKRKKNKSFLFALCALLCAAALLVAIIVPKGKSDENGTEDTPPKSSDSAPAQENEEKIAADLNFKYTEETTADAGKMNSESFIFVRLSDNTVLTHLDSSKRMYPASTTKLMTMLVAVEHIEDFNDTVTFTFDMINPLYRQDATMAGFSTDEVVTMTDVLYGLILPSGGDAAVGIAQKIAGSEEQFVKLMNEKAGELGLKNTHFTNVTGLFNQEHYSTVEDMAKILALVMKNELCKKILATYQYTSAPTNKHPEGIPMTNTMFKYMYGTEPEGAVIEGGKTGYVNESGYCIASFGSSEISGEEYVCVTFKARSKYPAVYDHINLYTKFAKYN